MIQAHLLNLSRRRRRREGKRERRRRILSLCEKGGGGGGGGGTFLLLLKKKLRQNFSSFLLCFFTAATNFVVVVFGLLLLVKRARLVGWLVLVMNGCRSEEEEGNFPISLPFFPPPPGNYGEMIDALRQKLDLEIRRGAMVGFLQLLSLRGTHRPRYSEI